jgi:hypothetical protein
MLLEFNDLGKYMEIVFEITKELYMFTKKSDLRKFEGIKSKDTKIENI